MASVLIVDPLKLVRVAPLVLSTSTLTYAFTEGVFYNAFLHPPQNSHSNAILPSWWNYTFRRLVWFVVAGYSLNTIVGTANVLTERDELKRKGSLVWYAAGAAFSFGHFLFVPAVMGPVQDIVEDRLKEKGGATEAMRRWLGWHAIRIATVDIPGWICNSFAVLSTVSL